MFFSNLPSNFIFQWFARDDGNFLAQPLVGMEIDGQLGVILLNDDPRGLFDRLCSHTTLKSRKIESPNVVTQKNIVTKPKPNL